MQYILDKNRMDFYNRYSFSLEDRISKLVGRFVFIMGKERKG